MTTPASYWEEPDCDANISRSAAAAIGERLFAYITSTETIALSAAGGKADGITVAAVTAAGDKVTIYTEGAILVTAGGTVTAGSDVMSDAAGKAVDATFGNLSVGYAETGTTTSGDKVRVRLYERPQHIFGSGLGAEKIAKKTLTGAAIQGGVQNWQNPESVTILVSRVLAVMTTKSTGAGTLDVGTTATDATTASDNLIDGFDSNAAAVNFDNTINGGTNGKAGQTLAAGKWITFKSATGDTSGALPVDFYIFYTPLS